MIDIDYPPYNPSVNRVTLNGKSPQFLGRLAENLPGKSPPTDGIITTYEAVNLTVSTSVGTGYRSAA
jgi:hypothetical protein